MLQLQNDMIFCYLFVMHDCTALPDHNLRPRAFPMVSLLVEALIVHSALAGCALALQLPIIIVKECLHDVIQVDVQCRLQPCGKSTQCCWSNREPWLTVLRRPAHMRPPHHVLLIMSHKSFLTRDAFASVNALCVCYFSCFSSTRR